MSEFAVDKSVVNGIRTALGIGGVLSLILGILILVWPARTAFVAVSIVAIYAIAAGLVYAGLGIFSRSKSGWSRTGHIVLGVLYVIAGVVAFTNLPAATEWFGIFIGVMVGIVWLVEGVVSLSTLADATSKGWTVFFASLTILAGVMLLFSPLWGAVVLWWLLGTSAVATGLVQLIRAFTFGR
ncbi:HdeD family acid-resistance protein [Microbacterium sp.]|uniref:HdeD family acid-resistance protein n=1 Tax=Microbacterium sp. TaxID=51671 RepID=UPI0039E6D270